MKKYIKLLRIEQWIKNIFVFLPLFFSGSFLHLELFSVSLFAFFIFSFTASCIYIINDYIDIEADKKHPEKCKRPLASGKISKSAAKLVFASLVFLIIFLTSLVEFIFSIDLLYFSLVIAAYFIMNIAYTFRLKHIAIVDISIIALGFVFRVLAGGYITGIWISQWAILLTFLLALVLAIGKRRGELIKLTNKRKNEKSAGWV